MTNSVPKILRGQKFLLTCLLRDMTISALPSFVVHGFYSHASCETWLLIVFLIYLFESFYSHASCETWPRKMVVNAPPDVSTHMPLARHDVDFSSMSYVSQSFYSHASCETWLRKRPDRLRYSRFLLTCLLRDMTASADFKTSSFSGFYSHASCETWLLRSLSFPLRTCFYSHASCETWPEVAKRMQYFLQFLLTCLLRDMTRQSWRERQRQTFLLTCLLRDMTERVFALRCSLWFLLTCLLRDMTFPATLVFAEIKVSTHMPLARHDKWTLCHTDEQYVSTHMPLARHDLGHTYIRMQKMVSTHMPLARHDNDMKEANTQHKVSTHMPLARHDT